MASIHKNWKKPKLRNPSLVAAWPGMGNVAMTAVGYLKDKLFATKLGHLEYSNFFAPTGASVEKQIIQSPDTPSNQFFYYQSNSENGSDILFFIGSAQPIPHMEYEFASKILEIAEMFGVKRIFTTAAAPSDMYFKDKPRVFAVPNQAKLLRKLTDYDVHFMGDGTIAGLNGLLISVAAERGIDGICFLGEIPFFTAQIEYPRASLIVLEILTKLLGVQIDLVDLELIAEKKEKEIEPLAGMLSKEKQEDESQLFHLNEEVLPGSTPKISQTIRKSIEKLFSQAEFDRTYKSKMRLKEELDKHHLFEEYLDRFLDLFKKGKEES